MDWTWIGLGLLGIVVGFMGTLIGAGGGFLLMPILLILYPGEPPGSLASISLGVVCFNAVSGSIGYARQKLIDYRSGVMFSLAGVPGAIVGALLVTHLNRTVFDGVLGGVLLIVGVSMLIAGKLRPHPAAAGGAAAGVNRRPLGMAISFGVGVLSSLLGIGGGIIHVPAMVYALGFPVHTAIATSHFVLATTSVAGTAVHVFTGALNAGWSRTIAIGLGAVIGAQFGAALAPRARSAWIIRGLGAALAVVGSRLIYAAWAGIAS